MNVAMVSRDLMDRSKLDGAIRAAGHEVVSIDDADLVLADLRQVTPEQVEEWAAQRRVIVFGPHVDTDGLEAVSRAGAVALARSVFFRSLPELLVD